MVYEIWFNAKGDSYETFRVYVEAGDMDEARDKAQAEFPQHHLTSVAESPSIAMLIK